MIAAAGGGVVLLGILAFAASKRRRKGNVQVQNTPALPGVADAKALAAAGKDAADVKDTYLPAAATMTEEAANMDRLIQSVRTTVGTDPALVAGVLRNWLEER
jgi:flagellar biosynthesis/type III secretory pathway M-ring protein FliF/YscJ